MPKERTSPTQPFPTKPAPFDRQGVSENDLIDLTPALRAEALEVVKRYKIGPLYHAAGRELARRTAATLTLPAETAAPTGQAARFDPDDQPLCTSTRTRTSTWTRSCRRTLRIRLRTWRLRARGRASAAAAGDAPGAAAEAAAAPAGRGAGAAGTTTVQGLPLIKPPYDRITAYDMNTGEIVWQKTHSSTPDDIRNHPALKGLDLPRLGQPGRTFIGTLTTKNLVIAGEGGVHTNGPANASRCCAPTTRRPAPTSARWRCRPSRPGSPMTYLVDGKQYIVVAVSGNDGAELLAYALPRQ